jgi:hypothetical protein
MLQALFGKKKTPAGGGGAGPGLARAGPGPMALTHGIQNHRDTAGEQADA